MPLLTAVAPPLSQVKRSTTIQGDISSARGMLGALLFEFSQVRSPKHDASCEYCMNCSQPRHCLSYLITGSAALLAQNLAQFLLPGCRLSLIATC